MASKHTEAFLSRCINETLAGLRDGLSRFSGTSRSAVIFCIEENSNLLICDPQNLLSGHEPKLRDIYLESSSWKCETYQRYDRKLFSHIDPEENVHLDGLICYGGRSGAVYYQMWFTEHHPDMCSTGPTQRWLEHAVLRFSHDMANESTLYTGISGSFLREYATHAVHDYIVDQVNLHFGIDSGIRIFPVLEAILGISRTPEEGAVPFGEIVFVEPRLLDNLNFIARFRHDQQPNLNHYKHIRKLLLAVEISSHKLVSDGSRIIGICDNNLPDFCLTADFQGKSGFLAIKDETICSFGDGTFTSTTHQARLFEVEEILLDYDLDTSHRNELYQAIRHVVHSAESGGYGCTLVVDLAEEPREISGQHLQTPIDLCNPVHLELACGLSRTDGALHITADSHLHAFACLLDGVSIANEDRARGARYNSALRFSVKHQNSLVVVVSSDKPVSVIYRGEEVGKRAIINPYESCALFPETLQQWLDRDAIK